MALIVKLRGKYSVRISSEITNIQQGLARISDLINTDFPRSGRRAGKAYARPRTMWAEPTRRGEATIKLTNGNSKAHYRFIELSFTWGALALKLRVALREALCACALQIIIILVKLCDFLPAKTKTKIFFIKRWRALEFPLVDFIVRGADDVWGPPTSWLRYDFRASLGSWRSHDVRALPASSGLCPDDVWVPPTSVFVIIKWISSFFSIMITHFF
jgi:hypothetical protein